MDELKKELATSNAIQSAYKQEMEALREMKAAELKNSYKKIIEDSPIRTAKVLKAARAAQATSNPNISFKKLLINSKA